MSRGTAISIIAIGRWRLLFSACSTAPLPRIGNCEAVEDIVISASDSLAGMSLSLITSLPNRSASLAARSGVRLAIRVLPTPLACKCCNASSMVSPAPISSAVCSFRSPNICRASDTAANATETGLAPTSVSVRTCLATLKADWKSRVRSRPTVPDSPAVRKACLIWPRICGSPRIIESRPLHTLIRCWAASRS